MTTCWWGCVITASLRERRTHRPDHRSARPPTCGPLSFRLLSAVERVKKGAFISFVPSFVVFLLRTNTWCPLKRRLCPIHIQTIAVSLSGKRVIVQLYPYSGFRYLLSEICGSPCCQHEHTCFFTGKIARDDAEFWGETFSSFFFFLFCVTFSFLSISYVFFMTSNTSCLLSARTFVMNISNMLSVENSGTVLPGLPIFVVQVLRRWLVILPLFLFSSLSLFFASLLSTGNSSGYSRRLAPMCFAL